MHTGQTIITTPFQGLHPLPINTSHDGETQFLPSMSSVLPKMKRKEPTKVFTKISTDIH